MPRLASRPPKYCRHKGTGLACVYVNGREKYLGAYNSPESKQAYREFVAEWAGKQLPPEPEKPADAQVARRVLSIAEALMQYKQHAERYYKTRETDNLREALRPLRVEFGLMPLDQFGPLQLRQIRNRWIEKGLARNTINARVIRIKRFFRWCVSYEMVDVAVLNRLDAVESLMPGRGGKECEPKSPVSWETLEATLPHMPEMVRSMCLFAWHTGARPSEVTTITTGCIDRTRDIWVATPRDHKTRLWGKSREIYIGRAAQQVISPWLLPEQPDEPIFSPRRVDERQPKRQGKRLPGRTYSRAAFQQVIRRACRRGEIPEWSPNMLRHAYGSRLREAGGVEASQIALGHAKPDTTLIYTSHAKARALEAIRALDRLEASGE
jgi:integrase